MGKEVKPIEEGDNREGEGGPVGTIIKGEGC